MRQVRLLWLERNGKEMHQVSRHGARVGLKYQQNAIGLQVFRADSPGRKNQMSGPTDKQLRSYARDLSEIIEARKRAGLPPIKRRSRAERYEEDPNYNYLNDAGTDQY